MSEKRKVTISLETFLKRSWPLIVGGAVLVFVLCGTLFYVAISGKARRDSVVPPVGAEETSTSTEALIIPRKLDGVPVAPDQASLQAYAVMVENLPDSRPLSGPAKANIVMEAPVEGGITRFLLLFDATTTADQIGPVRSARPYYVDWAEGLDAVYAHVGGSPEALTKIAILGNTLRNVDEFSHAKYFWRSTKRAAPHNVYTRTDLLQAATEAKKWTAGSFRGWQYLSATSTEFGDVTSVTIPYGGSYTAIWKYDAETNRYTRLQSGVVQKDADGSVVTAANVVVMLTEQQVLDDVGRLRLRTTGTGKAVLFRDGKRFDVVWRRKAGEWISFETVEGGEVLFEPGTTWISVVSSAGMMP